MLIEDLLENGSTFIDVGANVGYHTLLAGKRVGSRGRVASIEASSELVEHLRSNVLLARLNNVRVIHAAASDREGELSLYGDDKSNLGRTSTYERPGLKYLGQVMAAPMEILLTDDERRTARLIKIDIEGGEIPVLRNIIKNNSAYASQAAILVEFSHEDREGSEWAFSELMALGYRAYQVPNEYSFNYYLIGKWSMDISEVFSLPQVQCDILFQRAPFSWSKKSRKPSRFIGRPSTIQRFKHSV